MICGELNGGGAKREIDSEDFEGGGGGGWRVEMTDKKSKIVGFPQ